jgi:hypothetical protein
MLLVSQNITVRQLIILSIGFGFKRCELWTDRAYVQTHHPNKKFLSHRIASKKIDLLIKAGFSDLSATKLVLLEGEQKVNKKNLALLGEPTYVGTLDGLGNKDKADLWDKLVYEYHVTGIVRRKVIIVTQEHCKI